MSKLERYIIGATITAIIIFLVWFFSNIVVYILVSVILSLLGKPLVDLICKFKYRDRQIPKWLAATITVSIMWVIAVLSMKIFLPIVLNKLQGFTAASVDGIQHYLHAPLNELKEFLQTHFNYTISTSSDAIISDIYQRLGSVVDKSISGVGSIIDFVINTFVALFSITFITFFFLKESNLFNSGVIILFPQKYEKSVREALDTSINLVSRYFVGLAAESTVKTIIITVGLYFMGFDFAIAFTIAIISGILNVIPYIGPMIGIGVGLLIGITTPVAQADLFGTVMNMTILFLVFQIIDNIILQPYIYSSSVKAHPLEIFLVILIAGSLAGVWGMLLAIPAYTIFRVFAKIFLKQFKVVQKLTDSI